jgi:anti-sigma factor RsiW
MNCFNEQNADLLMAYFENTLTAAERKTVDAHTAECQACRELLGVHRTMDAYEAPTVAMDFDRRLYARIAAEQAKPWWHVANWKLVIPVTAVAAMLAVGVFVLREQPQPAGNTKADLDVQQIEQALDDLELLMPLPGEGGV